MTQAADPATYALQPFVRFASVLRAGGFPAAPDQTENFVAAVGLLGPRGHGRYSQRRGRDLRAATGASRRVRCAVSDGVSRPDPRCSDHERGRRGRRRGVRCRRLAHGIVAAGHGRAARHGSVDLRTPGEPATSAQVARRPRCASSGGGQRNMLPRQPSRRWRSYGSAERRRLETAPCAASGGAPRWRSAGAALARPQKDRQRRMVLLIDVSGSMSQQTDQYLRFAHTLVQQAARVEVFTLGTRLTRVTRALEISQPKSHALSIASTLVADWDGGTQARRCHGGVPRRAGLRLAHARRVYRRSCPMVSSAADSEALASAVERLSRLAWSLLWLNPLAADASYEPQTEAMRAISPFIDRHGPWRPHRPVGRRGPLVCAESPAHEHHRCASSHLAPGRSAVAAGPDATAHLRCLRRHQARLSDRRIRRRIAADSQIVKVGLRAGQLACRPFRRRSGLGPGRCRQRQAGRPPSSDIAI